MANMSLEEALAQSDTYAQSESENVFVIDAENRTINIPTGEILFGVEGDKDVERKYFQCPKIVGDNIDLSQHQIYIAYVFSVTQNNTLFPEYATGLYHCEDVAIEGDNITFSWLLSGNVFANPGFIAFKITAQKNEGSELKTKWNTVPAYGTVLLTVPDGDALAEQYPDVFNQILDRLDELEENGGGGSTPGKDGREIELQNSGTAIQWRYEGDESWIDLVQLSEITGEKGDPGITPAIGENGNWYLGGADTGKPSRGEKGNPGDKGDPGEKGDPGPTGATPNIQIGTVQTLEPEQQATASMTGTPENPVLNLGIPKGEQGPAGDSVIVPRQEMQNTDTTVTLEPNKLYVFPEMASLTVTLGTPTDSSIVNEWHWFFDSGETACVFVLQSQDGSQVYTDAYSIDANMRYEVSVLNNVAYIKGVAITSGE